MNHTVDQLPTPITFAPAPAPVQAPASPRRSRRTPGAALAIAVAAVGGLVGFLATRDDDPKSSAPSATDGVAGGSSITREELAAAYTATFGVAGSQATLDCVTTEIGGAGTQAERLARGEALTQADAREAFTPFMTCAPDDDFLYLMVPAAVQALGGSADEACISDYFLTFGVAARADARALAYVSTNDFAASLQATFAGCTV